MPRVTPLTEQERNSRRLREQIVGGIRNEKLTNKAVAEALGVSYQTFYRRIEHPETLTIAEFWELQKIRPDLEI